MSITAFLFLFSVFSVLTGLVVEAIKKFLADKENRSYNIIVLIVAMIIGVIGTLLYYYITGVAITMAGIIFAILMGLASALGAMIGYDKVKEAIEQLGK